MSNETRTRIFSTDDALAGLRRAVHAKAGNFYAMYSSVLGGQSHTIRRVELGDKGTYYRAMVGPFATREQAVQLCSSLKSAGGDCVVQSN